MYLVVSASTHPEPQFMAEALSQAGEDVVLATAASFAADEPVMRIAQRLSGHRLAAQVLRRRLPEGLKGQQVFRAGYVHEGRQLWQRVVRGNMQDAARTRVARDRIFHDRVVDFVRERRPGVIIAQQNSAAPAFEAAGSTAYKILGYPIAHHRWLKQALEQECATNPDWADYIDPSDSPSSEDLARLDREVELADHIIVVSNFVRDTCIDFGVPAEKISVVQLAAFPAPAADAQPPAGLFPEGANFRIIFTGQVVQRKGVSYLIEAFAPLAADGACLTFVGSCAGDLASRLTALPGVRVLPPMPRPQLMAAQRAADVGVLPSLGEGFPLTAIETLSAGTPMIVSDATFAHDVIEDGVNGFVIPASDASALNAALRRMMNDPAARERMKEYAASSVESFTWPAYKERFLTTISGLVNAKERFDDSADTRVRKVKP